ncbi:MAG: polymer-forming cytoskeletal protein, partial [Oscillospiraceae bacterium]|nr:polymer-forming cytoskeletal protein [Oscillospiraceae bacterium]
NGTQNGNAAAQPDPVLPYNDPPPVNDGDQVTANEAVHAEESGTASATYADEPPAARVPFPPVSPSSYTNGGGNGFNGSYNTQEARQIFDFDASELYSDEKTVISKNTVIRGNLQTNDPMRMMGQVMGDIECRSNIIIAGKMRGNTAATNAHVLDAQIDGDMLCDDSISINENAWILGNIRAQQAEIGGKIKGNLEIRHAVSIGASSSIIGNISADELEITRGAFVNGQIIMYSPSRDVIDRFDNFESPN